uniref:Uncharacterized protein TCIL3000_10_2950 n=1 Tax=Trypanosoma congolense (strain IL3000) TaxID=1068625 RepID=G0UVW8_TRYCI|nr:unnamed protein product [Trypanosoma congolense IL3000]
MKLLKFINCDGPGVSQATLEVSRKRQRVSVVGASAGDVEYSGRSAAGYGGDRSREIRAWHLRDGGIPLGGCYWLLDDDDRPMYPIGEVLLAVPDNETLSVMPKGVNEEDIKSADFLTKAGRDMRRRKQEFGDTYKNSVKRPLSMTDVDGNSNKQDGKSLEGCKAVARHLESGEELAQTLPSEKRGDKANDKAKSSKKSRKER